MKPIAVVLFCLSTLMLGSCASWRQWFSRNPPSEPTKPSATQAAAVPAVDPPAPENPAMPDDGFRLPDMLAMPSESEFKSTVATPPPPGSGTVIARPPTAAAESSPAETIRPETSPPSPDR